MTTSNTAIIQAIYAAFGRGDVPAIVDAFVSDGAISFNAARVRAPWQASVKGRSELPAFFTALATNVEFALFEPTAFVADGDVVVVRVHMRFTVKATARVVDQSQVHWWEFSGAQVRSLVHFEDTAQIAAAVAG